MLTCVYLVALYAFLLYLLKLAFEFSLPLQSFLSSAHIQDSAIQLFAIHFSHCLPQSEGMILVSISTDMYCTMFSYPPGISVVFKVHKPKATRASPFIRHHTDAEGLTCEPEPALEAAELIFLMKSACTLPIKSF